MPYNCNTNNSILESVDLRANSVPNENENNTNANFNNVIYDKKQFEKKRKIDFDDNLLF